MTPPELPATPEFSFRVAAGRRGSLAKPRLALLAAFPFPLPQGSQVFVAEQARALARAGADVTLICYGNGVRDDETLGALSEAGVRISRAPAALSRTPLSTGPSLRKVIADGALLGTLLVAERRTPFDAILAHNGEAACVALAARAITRTPVVYVAHTLFGSELGSYAPALAARAVCGFGRRLDALLARRADAVVTLSAAAAAALGPFAAGRVAHVPPALDPAPAPSSEAVEEACRRHGLVRGSFAVYAGNLDAYQDLALLAQAAQQLGQDEVVAVTHDPRRGSPPGLRVVRAASAPEVRRLLFGAALAVVPRRSVGGFPIKLLNYMEAGLAIVGFEGVLEGLTHRRDAWLLPPAAGPAEIAAAIRTLRSDPAFARQLGTQARSLLEARFAWKTAVAHLTGDVLSEMRTHRAGAGPGFSRRRASAARPRGAPSIRRPEA